MKVGGAERRTVVHAIHNPARKPPPLHTPVQTGIGMGALNKY